jgi:PfaB family protein
MTLAIIGMDVFFAGCVGLDAFQRCIYEGIQVSGRIPPDWRDETRLLSKVVKGALSDAGLTDTSERPLKAALLSAVGSGQVPTRSSTRQAAGIEPARLVARETGLTGPVLDFSENLNPWIACLDKAQEILEVSEADVVVIAAAALGIEPASSKPGLAIRPAGSSFSMGFDLNAHGWVLGEGGAAIVVMREADAARESSASRSDPVVKKSPRVYARILAAVSNKGAFAAPGLVMPDLREGLPGQVSPLAIRQCCESAFQAAGIKPGDIGYLDVFGSGSDPLDEIEISGLVEAYRQDANDLTCGIGSAQANVGFTFAAAGLASLVRTALILYYRFIPAVPAWSGPKLLELWKGSPFYVAGDSRTWFPEKAGAVRLAAINGLGAGAACAHVILGEDTLDTIRSSQVLSQKDLHLFPLAGGSAAELVDQLSTLRSGLQKPADLFAAARRYYDAYQTRKDARFAVAILGHDALELGREIDFALKGLPTAFERGTEWQTPLGSYFTPAPLGIQAGIAFVYPGAFSSYAGFGRDLFYLFPQYYERLASLVVDVGAAIQERRLYPRSLEALSKEELDAIEGRLNTDPIAMLTSGMCMAILFTLILNESFKIRNQAAFGYSLGENSMMFASGVMTHGWEGKKRLEESPLFRTRLAGPQNAVREYWGLAPSEDGRVEEDFWANYVLMASPEQVKDLIEDEECVFLTHINTPRQVAIAGDPKGCLRLIETLHCNALRAPFNYALHCPAMQSEYPALVELHSWPISQQPEIALYSSADCDRFPMDSDAIARKMARGLCSTVDFPKLVNKVYDNGARIFIELGAGSNCSKWVDDTLKTKPHCAMSINRRGVDDHTSILRVLGRLCSQRVPLDLSPLYKAK